MSNVVSLHDHQTKVWEAYVKALKRAEASCAIEDGIAAGKAYRRWLDLFLTEDQRDAIGGRAAG